MPETFAVDEERQTRSPEHPSPNTVSASAVIPVVNTVTPEQCSTPTPSATEDRGEVTSTKSVRQTERAQVFVVEATDGSPSSVSCQDNQDIGPDLTREGPFDVSEVEPDPGQSPLVLNSIPGCQFLMTSYHEQDSRGDFDPAYGIHLHDPRMMEYMGAPESARLLGRSPEYWLQHMGRDRAVAAALRLHHDASLIMTNVQVMSQFVTSLNRTASEVMRMVYDKPPFPTDAVEFVTPGRTESVVRCIIWQRWACGALPVLLCFPGQSRSPHAIRAWPARTAFRMPRSDDLLLPQVPRWKCIYMN